MLDAKAEQEREFARSAQVLDSERSLVAEVHARVRKEKDAMILKGMQCLPADL